MKRGSGEEPNKDEIAEQVPWRVGHSCGECWGISYTAESACFQGKGTGLSESHIRWLLAKGHDGWG